MQDLLGLSGYYRGFEKAHGCRACRPINARGTGGEHLGMSHDDGENAKLGVSEKVNAVLRRKPIIKDGTKVEDRQDIGQAPD